MVNVKKSIALILVSVSLMLSGCASIVGDNAQSINVNSDPSGANFLIKDDNGKAVSQGTTPASISLQKSDGSYFGKKQYNITFSKDGYSPVTLPIKSNANGWYIAGNLLFGGLIGWFAVDPFNGGMYTLNPKETNAILATKPNPIVQ